MRFVKKIVNKYLRNICFRYWDMSLECKDFSFSYFVRVKFSINIKDSIKVFSNISVKMKICFYRNSCS